MVNLFGIEKDTSYGKISGQIPKRTASLRTKKNCLSKDLGLPPIRVYDIVDWWGVPRGGAQLAAIEPVHSETACAS